MTKYRTVSTHTIKGLEQAEKLKARGWKIIQTGLFMLVFEKKVQTRLKRRRV